MTEETKLAYSANHTYREGYDQGKADRDAEICRKLQRWSDMTREVNPDISIGYDHSVILIRNDFIVESDLIKTCDNCEHREAHEKIAKGGCEPMCCIHCAYANDLRDKWKGRQ